MPKYDNSKTRKTNTHMTNTRKPKTRKNNLALPRQFYSLEKRLLKINGKVFENTITETKNNIMHKKGYLYGKKINKTRKINV